MKSSLNFQSIILELQRYWAKQGCLIAQPYYLQVGAGTMNPATFLRVLGPEPWNVAYVEPSVRPDDGRYGENPNRLQQHTQFQVILKPDPGNPQELYLRSLQAIGIDPKKHDIRFVEDNWESPALGAWGLGWQVWLDGQEITQFTYFQQAGGLNLDPVSVEITYGLDRVTMTLQGVRHVGEVRWNEARTWGDVNLQGEQEHSKYYFEVADVSRLRQMYDLFEAEANAALNAKLILPAYDSLLKCSHTFNVLDTRGAIGVTERQGYFGRMRKLAGSVANLYVENRQRLEFPWLEDGEAGSVKTKRRAAKASKAATKIPTKPAPFLLEIGTEELPAGDLDWAMEQLTERVPALLSDLRLKHGKLRVLGTPRRLVVHVENLAPRQPDREEVVKGPPAKRAFGADGTPTKAAEGFAQSKGVAVSDLKVVDVDGGQYVTALVKEKGRPAVDVLAEALPDLIAGLRFEKSMRWNASNVAFSRPIRWLVALFDGQAIPFECAGLEAGNITRGLRFARPEEFSVKDAADYFEKLEAQGILLDPQKRRAAIQKKVNKLAQAVGGAVADDLDLLTLSTHQAEAPNVVRGTFDKEFLDLPAPVLIAVMKKHQNYFPVEKDSTLLPYFITVGNGDWEDGELVARGNADVLRARFADAQFFIKEDLKRPLADYVPRLATLTFQKDLGAMLDKTKRIVALVDELAGPLGLSKEETDIARRAAELCKADLATRIVVEMTSLQGVMGEYYAEKSGESKEVATAIFEHYLPRYDGEPPPQSIAGMAVAIADILDTLLGLFAVGITPSGNKDPFGLRKSALRLVLILQGSISNFDIRTGLRAASKSLPTPVSSEVLQTCLEFTKERIRHFLSPYRFDIVDAVLAAQGHNVDSTAKAVRELQNNWAARKDWREILPAFARCVRITRDQKHTYNVDPGLLFEPAEKELYEALQKAKATPRAAGSVDDFLNAFVPMIPAVNKFFDDVLVMAEDENLRRNRLGLLQHIVALADGVADFSKLEGF